MTEGKLIMVGTCTLMAFICLAFAFAKQPDKPQREPDARRYSQVATVTGKGTLGTSGGNGVSELQMIKLADGTRCVALLPYRYDGGTAISCDWARADLYINQVEEPTP